LKTSPRIRRSPDEARRLILEAAEKRLAEGGPDAVRVQKIAADLGITDAAIYHHFETREGLLDALARFGARQLKTAIEELLAGFAADSTDVQAIAVLALETFEKRGYARLVLWLSLHEIPSDRGSGMFDGLGVTFERIVLAAHPAAPDKATLARQARFLASLLVMVVFADPLLGTISRRSLGLGGDRETTLEFRAWFVDALAKLLEQGEPSAQPTTESSAKPAAPKGRSLKKNSSR
jgi:AcrR family transcriptional regulator